ncbi:MAG: phage tail protein, partial [Candidatus Babeliales bacterium]
TAAVLRQVNSGTSPYPKQGSFLVKRTEILTDGTAQWYPTKATIGFGLNAIHILRECYTNETWGFNKDSGLFDDAVWQAAADIIYTEGLGLSMKWEQDRQTLKQFVADVCRHVDANVYREPETGKYVIKLVRADYTAATLDVFDDDDIVSVNDFTRPTVFECANTFQLKYWDIFTNAAVAVTDHELALLDMQGGDEISQELIYYGITDGDVATAVLARDELELTCFPATMRVKGNRKLSSLRPGDVFKLTWSSLDIVERIIRVLNVDLGSLQNNVVTLRCMEDVFAMQGSITVTPPVSGWTKPSESPLDVDTVRVFETPFWDVYTELGDLTTAIALDSHAAFMSCAIARPISDYTLRRRIATYGYEGLVSDTVGGLFYSVSYSHYIANAAILNYLSKDAIDVVVQLEDTDVLSHFTQLLYAIIDDEILKVLAYNFTTSPPTLTLARGCLDTVPAEHNGPNSSGYGARLWLINTYVFRATVEYTQGDTPQFKALPYTLLGNLASGDATAWTASAFNDRQARPYPPGDVKVNGTSYPPTFSGDLAITWAHRDRTQQLDSILEHSDAGVGPEAGTTYTVQVYDENDVLIHTETGLTGTGYTYTEAQEMIDCGFGTSAQLNSQLRFTLKSVRSGFDSWQSYDLTISRV